MITKPLEVGDVVEVYLEKGGGIKGVEVTCLHSGYYDYAYTGKTSHGRTVYFDFVQGWYVGREV